MIKIVTSFPDLLGGNAEGVENWAASVGTSNQVIGIADAVQ